MPDTSGWGPQTGPPGQGPMGHGPTGYGPAGYGPAGYGPAQPGHGTPPPGHGQAPPPGGWWQNPWGPPPPPPPKPGVIPLAPLGVDDILGGAFATMRRCAKPLFGTALAAYGLLAALVAAAFGVAYAVTRDDWRALSAPGGDFSWDDGRPLLIAFGAVWAVGALGTLVVNSFVQASCAATLHDAAIGRPTTFRAVWRKARSRTAPVVGVTLLLSLVVMMPAVMFAVFVIALVALVVTQWIVPLLLALLATLLVIPLTAWLYVRYAFAPAAVVLESAGPLTALRRSARLVRGAWWRTFGITLLAAGMVLAVSMSVRLPLQFLLPQPDPVTPGDSASEVFFDQLTSQFGLYALVGIVLTLLTQLAATVFLPLVTALLYVDRRIRVEGLADTLAAASAVRDAPPAAAPR